MHVFTVLIDEHCHYCFAFIGSQLFYYSDGGYGMSVVPGSDATPQADYLGEWIHASKASIMASNIVDG